MPPSLRPRIGAAQLAPLLDGWRSDTGSGYRGLAMRLRLLVMDGRLPVDTVLPSERALAEAIDASRTTTTAAYRLLREEGFAEGAQGSGTWTALPARARSRAAVPWPGALDGSASAPDGSGDLSTAAPEAPPELHAAYTAALADLPRYLHGPGYVTQGLPGLRERIAARYTERGLPTSAEEVLVTNGALQALRLVLTTLGGRGDRVVVEHPTYPAAIDCVRRAGGRPVPFPVEDGWDVEHLRALLRRTGARAAYLMVDFHNPTGRLLTGPARAALGAALTEAGVLGIVDETNCELDLRPAALVGGPTLSVAATPMSGPGIVCLGSASKTLWGGLRVGWVRAGRSVIRRLAMARDADDLAGPVLEQLAAEHLLDDFAAIVGARRRLLAGRRDALRAALAEHLPTWSVPESEGGLFLWCHLPTDAASVDSRSGGSSALTTAARDLGLRLSPGPRFGVDGAFEARIRIPFGRPAEHLGPAVRTLAEAWRRSVGTTPDALSTTVV